MQRTDQQDFGRGGVVMVRWKKKKKKRTKDYYIPDCVAGGAPLPETGATGVAAEPAFGSDVGAASDWFFFLRPKKPRKPFLSWASASGATSELMISKYASRAQQMKLKKVWINNEGDRADRRI